MLSPCSLYLEKFLQMTLCRNLVPCTYTGPHVLQTWWCHKGSLLIPTGDSHGSCPSAKTRWHHWVVYNIIQCKHNCVCTWDGFISFLHLHIQSYFVNKPFQSYFNRWNPTDRFVYFLDCVIGHKFLQLQLQFRPSVRLCHRQHRRVDMQIHLHPFHLANTFEDASILSH